MHRPARNRERSEADVVCGEKAVVTPSGQEAMLHDRHSIAHQRRGAGQALARVARDMEGIFSDAPSNPAHAPRQSGDHVVALIGDPPHARMSWLPIIALVLLTALLIAGGTVWMAMQSRPGLSQASPRAVASRQAPIARTPAVHAPTSRIASAPVAVAPTAATRPVPPVARAEVPTRPPAQRVRPERAAQAERRLLPTPGARASQIYPEILGADRELREAYARAEYVGLDPKILRLFRDRWWQVRKDAESDPAYVTEAYYQLARELDAARRRS